MESSHPVEILAEKASAFVIVKKGTWGHEDWENFCEQVCASGFELNEYNRVALGNLLEALRYFYQLCPMPAVAPKKRAAPCKKAVPKKSVAK
jgi:hypothetical protein